MAILLKDLPAIVQQKVAALQQIDETAALQKQALLTELLQQIAAIEVPDVEQVENVLQSLAALLTQGTTQFAAALELINQLKTNRE